MLVALAVDEIRMLRYVLSRVNSKGKIPHPEVVRRPGHGKAPRRQPGKRVMTKEMRMSIDPRAQKKAPEQFADPRMTRVPAPRE